MPNVKQECIMSQSSRSNSCSKKNIFQRRYHCQEQSSTDLIWEKKSSDSKKKGNAFFFLLSNIHDSSLCLNNKRSRIIYLFIYRNVHQFYVT